jgi:protein TonB
VAREGVSADDMRHYRLSLASAARRFKRYPALARERGWEGTAEITLNVSTLMPGPEAVLVRSSGRNLLDEQALEMIAQAARITSLPEGLKGRDFRVLLPVKFSLEGDQ